jgi:hypothetical protein
MRAFGATVIGLASVCCVLAAGGCSRGLHQFEGGLHYDNLIEDSVKPTIRNRVRTELLAQAEEFGLVPMRVNDRTMTFRMEAPDWEFPLPGGGAQRREDPRVLEVVVDLGGPGAGGYAYSATMMGKEPKGFTDVARARLGIAVLAVREIFETPMDTDFIDRLDLGRIYPIDPSLIEVGRRGELRPRTGLLRLDEAMRLATREAERLNFAVEVPSAGVLVLRDMYRRPRGDVAEVSAVLTFETVPGGRAVRRLVLELKDEAAQVDSGYRTPEGATITTNDLLAERLGRVALAVAVEGE